jgi:hypothetical protein
MLRRHLVMYRPQRRQAITPFGHGWNVLPSVSRWFSNYGKWHATLRTTQLGLRMVWAPALYAPASVCYAAALPLLPQWALLAAMINANQ